MLINMNGKEEKLWQGVRGSPNKILSGGYPMYDHGNRAPQYGYQEALTPAQIDWDGATYTLELTGLFALSMLE